MYILAYSILLLALLVAVGGAGIGMAQIWTGKSSDTRWIEKANLGVGLGLIIASLCLLYGLLGHDFSLEYVYQYTDSMLPTFYRITAFWGGQAGSMLFWALAVSCMGMLFQRSKAYSQLSAGTKIWFWIFFLAIMAFFCLILTTWNNPFIRLYPAPAEGSGLNPMLQNPGMIFHPPLLFLGYGGFVIPGCLGLAQAMTRKANNGQNPGEANWPTVARPFTLTAWLFLTAGIVLGGWWAYMELGWGGYWAWDPVENASMIPWLLGTAAIHTCIMETRRNKLQRSNIFLMAMSTWSAFFATYLVRGNVVESVHAYAGHGVGMPLLVFVLFSLLVIIVVSRQGGRAEKQWLEPIKTREGFILFSVWMFIAIGLVILTATLWPVFSSLWSSQAQGLNANFYNRVCLPLFVLLTALLAVCPWLGWKDGLRNAKKLLLVLVCCIPGLVLAWCAGMRQPLVMLAMSTATAALASMILMLCEKSVRRHLPSLASYLIHLGLVLIVLGIACSGPGKTESNRTLALGETAQIKNFEVTLVEVHDWQTSSSGEYQYLEADLAVSKNGRELGLVKPQLRVYANFQRNNFAEAATLFSLYDEFYATLLGVDNLGQASLRLSSNPGVNWIWIGGIVMSLAPLIGLGRKHKPNSLPDGLEA